MATITLPAGKYTVLAEGTVTFQTRASDVVVEGTAPSAFTSGQWSVSYDETAEILTVTITDGLTETPQVNNVQAKVNSGSWINLTRASSGVYTTYFPDRDGVGNVVIRKVNLIGAGPDSDTKPITFTEASVTINGLVLGTAYIGSHGSITYTIEPDNGTETAKWGTANDDDTYGTGSSPTDYTAGDGGNLVLTVTEGAQTFYRTAPIRYAPGTAASILDDQTFVVDTAITSINAAASGSNLTFTYTLSGGPTGLSIDSSTGLITGTPTTVSSGTATVTATDQYSRTLVSTFTYSVVLPIGGFDPLVDQSFTENTGNQTYVFTGATGTGLTWTYTLVGSISGVTIDSGTQTITFDTNTLTVQSNTLVTVRATDQYSRTIDRTFNFDIVDASGFAMTLSGVSYTAGSNGSGPILNYTLGPGSETGPFETFISTHPASTTLLKTNIENGTGDSTDAVSFSDADGVVTGQTETLSTAQTGGRLSMFVRANSGGETDVVQLTGVDVEVSTPTFSSSTPADNATGVASNTSISLTFSESVFGVVGKDFYLYKDIDTTPALVETFVFTTGVAATGDNGGSASIVGSTVTIFPGANMASSTQHSIRWEAGAVVSSWGVPVAANTGDTVLNFTTEAAPTLTFSYIGTAADLDAQTSYTFTDTDIVALDFSSGGQFLVMVCSHESTNTAAYASPTSVTIGGVTASSIEPVGGYPVVASNISGTPTAWVATVSSGATEQIVITTDASATWSGVAVAVYQIDGYVIREVKTNWAAQNPRTLSLSTESGSPVILGVQFDDAPAVIGNLNVDASMTNDASGDIGSGETWATYRDDAATSTEVKDYAFSTVNSNTRYAVTLISLEVA